MSVVLACLTLAGLVVLPIVVMCLVAIAVLVMADRLTTKKGEKK